jgi:4'-phosphopantetheinyl transferase
MNLTIPCPALSGAMDRLNYDGPASCPPPQDGVSPPTPNEIHLWQADLDELPDREEIWSRSLSSLEQSRARRFVFAKHRRHYLAAKAWTRRVLAAYLRLGPRAVPLTANAHGKPQMGAEANPADLRFNVSHCGRFVLLAVAAGSEVGVDVQSPLPEDSWPAVAERFFTRDEREYLRGLLPPLRASAFVEIWTRKEAAGKALGSGLTPRVWSLDVGPAARGAVDCGNGLWVWSLPAQDSFAAALAALTRRGTTCPGVRTLAARETSAEVDAG